MTHKPDIPNWLLTVVAHPVLTFGTLIVVLIAVPTAFAVYLESRLQALSELPSEVRPRDEPSGAVPTDLPQKIVTGETVYVPLYSYVYVGEGERLLLAGTLSIRNTDADRSLTLSGVHFYDTEGKYVRNFLDKPLKLKPLGTTDFLVKESDVRGGPGANFIVEWVADEPVHPPVIEAVMVSRKGGVGAFVSHGRVVRRTDGGSSPSDQ